LSSQTHDDSVSVQEGIFQSHTNKAKLEVAMLKFKGNRRHWLRVLIVILLAIAGVTFGAFVHMKPNSVSSEIKVEDPSNTAVSWFRSVDSNHLALAIAHFDPPHRYLMQWGNFGSFSFNKVHCVTLTESEHESSVRCTFRIPNPPPELENVIFWDIHFHKSNSGPWLITSYGQG
jgi:hypothetical protein